MFEYNPEQGCLWLRAEIDPVPQGRPRFSKFRGKARARTPGKTRAFNAELKGVAESWALAKRVTPLEGALAVFINFVIERPASVQERKRKYPLVKPDLDNYAKAVLDSLNGVFWNDDGQVTFLHLQKHYAEPGEKPAVEIIVEPAGWHMFRPQHRETALGRIAARAQLPVKAAPKEMIRRGVGVEFNFSEELP